MIQLIRTRLSYKVAVAASALTLIFALVAGAAVYVVMSLLIRGQVESLLASEATLRAEKVADLVEGLSDTFRTLSASPVIIDGIAGQAFGKEYMSSLFAGLHDVNGVATVVSALDRHGRVVAASQPSHVGRMDPWAAEPASQGRARARIAQDPKGPVLVIGLPVGQGQDGSQGQDGAYGSLVYQVALADLARRAGSPAGTGIGELVLVDGRDRHVIALGEAITSAHPLVREVPVRLPDVLAPTRISVRVGAESSLLAVPLQRLAMSMMGIGLLSTLLVVAVSVAMGRRLTSALSRLTDAATSFALGRSDRLPLALHGMPDGKDEIARLGSAFAGMVTRLDNAYQDLERRSQALLSNAERVAQVGSAVWHLKAGSHLWSWQFHSILGLVPDDAQPGLSSFFDRVHPDDRPRLKAILDAAIAAEAMAPAGAVVEDFRIVRADGDERVVQLRGQVAWDGDGMAERMDLTLQDITERKSLERKLDNLVHELRRSNEELEQFAYVASHDLRQPLRVVGSYVTLIEEAIEDKLDGETREFMDFIRDGVRRMDLLITDLLTYSRVGRSSRDGPVDAGRALDLALIDLQVEIDDAHARIRHPARMPVVLGDTTEMVRLFQNLIGNGVKYRSPDRVSEVHVGCKDAGTMWQFFVRDNGIGIPTEHIDRVFGIFQRLHARDEYDGTGIGLAICKKVVERQGGRIWIESEPGNGTMFCFTWPKLNRTT